MLLEDYLMIQRRNIEMTFVEIKPIEYEVQEIIERAMMEEQDDMLCSIK